MVVSIHAPVWGATSRWIHGEQSRNVSIHAPVWGATHRDKLHTTLTVNEIRQLVQDFVKNSDRKFLTNKFAIESVLLNECYHAIEQRTREIYDPDQPNLL